MAKPKWVPREKGFTGLMNGDATQAMLKTKVDAIKSAAVSSAHSKSAEYVTDVQPGKNRAHARCTTANEAAYFDQLKNKTLTKAIDAGRG